MSQTQFAPVCGVQMYEQMAILNMLPSYHLLLAHDIVARSKRYANVFQNMRTNYLHRTIILDNSVTELGTAVNVDVILEAAAVVKATVIVLPDVYEDAQATVKDCTNAYHEWKPLFDTVLGENDYSFMIVPQGKTIQEFAWCAEQFMNANVFPDIGWWGVPRNAVKWHGSRLPALRTCALLAPWRAVHMLGFSDNVWDDIMTVRNPHNIYVRGIDSAVPMRCAANGKPFSLGLGEMPKRPERWLEDAELLPEVIRDWEYAQMLISGF